MTWTAGWQRKLTADTVVEARYVGTRSVPGVEYVQLQRSQHRREQLPQRVPSGAAQPAGQHRRRAWQHVRVHFGACTGTAPLPIFLAHYNGTAAGERRRPGPLYGEQLDQHHVPRIPGAVQSTAVQLCVNERSPMVSSATQRSATTRRRPVWPANFWVANPDLIGGANIISNGGYTRYNSLQMELRKRLSHGLQFNTSYTFGPRVLADRYSFRRDRREILDVGARRQRGPRRQGHVGLRAAVRPRTALRQQRRRIHGPARRRMVVRRRRAHPERTSPRLRQRPPRGHVGAPTSRTCSSCGSTTPARRSTCCRRTSSTTPSRRSA